MYHWNSDYEPESHELRAWDKNLEEGDIETLAELREYEKADKEYRISYLDELAQNAWMLFITRYNKERKNKNLFIQCVVTVIPGISDRIRGKREIIKDMVSEIASRVSHMLHEGRKARAARKLRHPPKRVSYVEMKARRKREEVKALDILQHGTFHGELLLPGIATKFPVRKRFRKIGWVKRPKREHIDLDEQLVGIIGQVDEQIFRKKFAI